MSDDLLLPAVADMHIHLRQGALMHMVTPKLVDAGVAIAYVMPNLKPPVTTADQALAYKAELEKLVPKGSVRFMMTLYLTPELTPAEIWKAKKAGISGVKSYPRGVTTNSDSGIESYDAYHDVFAAMEEADLVLNLHGEVPSDAEKGICVLNAEENFLKHLKQLHQKFPKLRIVLEHATTKAAVDMVKSLGDTVGCTITAHHLELTVDDWAGKAHNFCKPVAKYPYDRQALREVIREGHPRFFLGTDSAPHPAHLKECASACAGVFTTPNTLAYVATTLEKIGAFDKVRGFACLNGPAFYKIAPAEAQVRLVRALDGDVVPKSFSFSAIEGDDAAGEVVPFMAGQKLAWRVERV